MKNIIKTILLPAILVLLFSMGCSDNDDNVYVIYEQDVAAGSHIAEMNLEDAGGNPIPAGYYQIEMKAEDYLDKGYFTIDTETWEQDPKLTGLQPLYPLGGYMKIPFSVPRETVVKFTVKHARVIGF